jgi:tRNA pseudouridine13 synthase
MNGATNPLTTLERLKQKAQHLPLITADMPGVGGVIKATPEHFEVEEILPYAPCGEGEHVFVTLRRRAWNTADVAGALAERFGLKSMDVGWGGRKDKQAVATQTFSLPVPQTRPLPEIEAGLGALPFEIIGVQRHRNKLKIGHVAGNRFRIVISNVALPDMEKAAAIAAALRERGVPNFYGEQRFGIRMANLDRAIALLQRPKPARGKKDAFLVSVLQSALFNVWLAERMQRAQFHTIIKGDVAKKTDTGGLFVVDDVTEAGARLASNAIVYTGPIFGYKMMPAADPAALFETQVMSAFGLDRDLFKRLRAPGSRRRALLRIDDLRIAPVAEGVRLAFTLPAGAYATVVTREFTRPLQINPETR